MSQIKNKSTVKVQTDSISIGNNNNKQVQSLNNEILLIKNQLQLKIKEAEQFQVIIRQKNIMINHLTQQLKNVGNKLDQQRNQFSVVQQQLQRLQSIYSRDSQIKRENLQDLQIIQRNQQLLQREIQNTKKINKQYLIQISNLKDKIDNLKLALQWSQQENYKFRLTIRQLKQKINLFQNIDFNANSNTNKKIKNKSKSFVFNTKSQQKSPQQSFNFEVIQLSAIKNPTKQTLFSETEISKKSPIAQSKINCSYCKTFGLKAYQIVNLLPLNQNQQKAMFEPENNEETLIILQIIFNFCKEYEKNMKKFQKQKKQDEDQATSLINKLLSYQKDKSVIENLCQDSQIKQNTFSKRILFRIKQMNKNNEISF